MEKGKCKAFQEGYQTQFATVNSIDITDEVVGSLVKT